MPQNITLLIRLAPAANLFQPGFAPIFPFSDLHAIFDHLGV
jgi:hypothetical protein